MDDLSIPIFANVTIIHKLGFTIAIFMILSSWSWKYMDLMCLFLFSTVHYIPVYHVIRTAQGKWESKETLLPILNLEHTDFVFNCMPWCTFKGQQGQAEQDCKYLK